MRGAPEGVRLRVLQLALAVDTDHGPGGDHRATHQLVVEVPAVSTEAELQGVGLWLETLALPMLRAGLRENIAPVLIHQPHVGSLLGVGTRGLSTR